MADSVDRVFAHALNTVKRIPSLGSARPPPSDRYRLYGLYKQSMEGDVDRVMVRPTGRGEDQAKWDAWNSQKGLSRTESKRQYISTLIETMHTYASQTPDARELVSELEFVWSQIKLNPPSDSSSHSPSHSNSNSNPYNYQTSNESPQSSTDPPIYPLMSERGSRNPRRDDEKAKGTDGSRLRVLSPISQSQQGDGEDEDGDPEVERFVDAPDSQIGMNDNEAHSSSERDERDDKSSPERQRRSSQHQARQKVSAAGAMIGPIAKYFTMQKQETQKMEDQTGKWQRRMEGALIKMNAEMAALREQLDWQSEHQRSSMYESLVHPFSRRSRRRGVLRLIFDPIIGLFTLIAKHAAINLAIVAVIIMVMHYKGIPVERLEDLINSWIRTIQQLRIMQRFKRVQRSQGQAAQKIGVAAYNLGNISGIRRTKR